MVQAKLRTIQYQGAKNFDWAKFSTTLQGYYEEMEMLGKPILATMQVRDLMPMIHHQKPRTLQAISYLPLRMTRKNSSRSWQTLQIRCLLWE